MRARPHARIAAAVLPAHTPQCWRFFGYRGQLATFKSDADFQEVVAGLFNSPQYLNMYSFPASVWAGFHNISTSQAPYAWVMVNDHDRVWPNVVDAASWAPGEPSGAGLVRLRGRGRWFFPWWWWWWWGDRRGERGARSMPCKQACTPVAHGACARARVPRGMLDRKRPVSCPTAMPTCLPRWGRDGNS